MSEEENIIEEEDTVDPLESDDTADESEQEQEHQEADEHDDESDNLEDKIAETIARARGWKSKENWKGDTSNWRPASEFNMDFEADNGKLRKDNRRLREQHEDDRKQREIIARTFQVMAERDKKKLEIERQQLREQMERAVDEGNADQYRALRKQEDALVDLPDVQVPDVSRDSGYDPNDDAAFTSWLQDNDWYDVDGQTGLRNDPDKAAYAEMIAGQLADTGHTPDREGRAFYDKITAAVNKKFSTSNSKTNGRRPPRVETGRQAAPGRRGDRKTWGDMPSRARKNALKAWPDLLSPDDPKERKAVRDNYAISYFENLQ